MERYDAIILGGGSGLTAAYYAEQDGKHVAVVEPGPLGGTCINRGCIPTKALIQSAEVIRTIRDAARFGIHLDQGSIQVDFPGILHRMRTMREANVAGTDAWIEGSDHIDLHRTRGRLLDGTTVELEDGTRLGCDRIFVCTGARPAIPPVQGLEDVPFETNRTVLNTMTEQPGRLAILGGGYIGLELAHFFASVGTDVTIVESKRCLLREDADVRDLVTREVGRYADLRNGTLAARVQREGKEIVLDLVDADSHEPTGEVRADALLVATGRRPNTEELGLEAAGVETNERGWIQVDDHLRTSNPTVYAYGDVIGQGMFKHTSSFEGEVAWWASQGRDVTMNYRANPHAVFTHPQVGSVGLTEEQVVEQGLTYRAAKLPYDGIAKGDILGSPEGFAKVLVEEGTDRILGFHVVGPQAANLISEVTVAMTHELGARGILDAIHVHPTLSELVHTVVGRA